MLSPIITLLITVTLLYLAYITCFPIVLRHFNAMCNLFVLNYVYSVLSLSSC